MRRQGKILVIDDNETNVEILVEMLEDDYQLETAMNGEEGLEIASDFQPDIILLDIMMPGINGYEVCKIARTEPVLRYTKIIMLSAKASVAERLKGYEAGADDYMTKPFEEEELLAKLRVYLKLKSIEEVDKIKSDIIALLGHETRTPLAGIISPAEMLLAEEDMEEEDRKKLLEMIYQSAKNLHSLFEKVMMLNSMKSGKWTFRLSPASLAEIGRDAVSEVSARASGHDIGIEEDLPVEPVASLDTHHMKNVVIALLDNAIRFSPPEEKIVVRISSDESNVRLSVTNHGDVIDPDFLPRVFDEFSVSDVSHHSEGHGLSLALSQQVVRHHNGSISAASTAEDGTIFTVRLPLAKATQLEV